MTVQGKVIINTTDTNLEQLHSINSEVEEIQEEESMKKKRTLKINETEDETSYIKKGTGDSSVKFQDFQD